MKIIRKLVRRLRRGGGASTPTSEEEIRRDEKDRSKIEPGVEIWEEEENKEDEDFLDGRTKNAIPARYKSDSDESIIYSKNGIAEGCC